MLSITVDWSVVEIREDGSAHMRPLEPGEDYTAGNLVPRFTIQAAGTTLSYPIDPSLPQGILRLNSNEITCVFIPVKGLDNSQLIELWDGIALTNLEKEVLNALRLIAPGVEVLTFVSTPVSVGKRIPIVKIADIDRPLLLSTLGDGMQYADERYQNYLLVEGNDDKHVLLHLLEYHRLFEQFRSKDEQLEIQALEGLDNLLNAKTLRAYIKIGQRRRFGIIVDADTNMSFRWQRLRDILEGAGYNSTCSATSKLAS